MSPPPTADGSETVDCQQCGADVEPTANFCPQCGTGIPDWPAVCRDCGESFADGAAFCSHCGAARRGGDSTANTSEPEETHEQFRRRVATYTEAGWEITADYGERVTVVDRSIGSIGVHILLLLFTGGFLNLAYGWYHYSMQAETRHLSVDGDSRGPEWTDPNSSNQRGTRTNAAGIAYLTGILLWFISLSFFIIAAGVGSLGVGLIGLLFAASGSYILPPVRRQFNRRHEVTMSGRHKTVDHRVIHRTEDCEEPCVVCGEPVSQGLVRRRRDETLVLGVPIRTHSLDLNHYCVACAREEGLVDAVDSDPAETTEKAAVTDSTDD